MIPPWRVARPSLRSVARTPSPRSAPPRTAGTPGTRAGGRGHTPDSRWRNRSEFFEGRPAIVDFLTRKWARELDYRLIKEIWAFGDDRIAVRFAYEWHTANGAWYRSYGNEKWQFAANGLMARRHVSINDVPITDSDRLFRWDAPGPRPEDHPGLTDLDL